MSLEIILSIVTGLLGIGSTVLAVYVRKFRNTLKEAAELFLAINDALEDNAISQEEAKRISKEAVDIYRVWSKAK